MRCACVGLGHDAFYLSQFFHQMQLGRQAPGRVHQHHVLAARPAGRDGVVTYRGRVAALLADDLDRIAIRPHRKLLLGGGAKGVGGRQQY